jgi:hypothetical protein
MSTYKINLKEQTATSINGITFKLTETNGEYEGVCLNPKDIPPDDLDDVVERQRKKVIPKYTPSQNISLF